MHLGFKKFNGKMHPQIQQWLDEIFDICGIDWVEKVESIEVVSDDLCSFGFVGVDDEGNRIASMEPITSHRPIPYLESVLDGDDVLDDTNGLGPPAYDKRELQRQALERLNDGRD